MSPLSTLSWQTSSLTSAPRVRPCFREWTFWVSVRNVASSQQSELCRALSPEVVRQRPADHLAGHAEGPVAASGGVAMERYDFHTCHRELRGPPVPPHTLGSPLRPPPRRGLGQSPDTPSSSRSPLCPTPPPMPHVAQEGDEAWPDSGAPLRQRPQDPQPGRTCPWGPGLGREAGRAGGQGEGPWSHLRVTHGLSVPQFPQPGSASRRASSGLSEGWGAPCCTPGASAYHPPGTTGSHDFPSPDDPAGRAGAGRGPSSAGCSPGSDQGQDPRGGGQDHQAHSGCPLWRIFREGWGRQGLGKALAMEGRGWSQSW